MIKPSDCLSVKDKEYLKQLESDIDTYLRNTYDGSRRLNLCHIIPLTEGKLRTEILHRYREAGWNVYFKPSSVDGLPEGPYFIEEGKE